MSQADNPYASFGRVVASRAPATERTAFIRRTYMHLGAAVYAFAALEFAFFRFLDLDQIIPQFFSFPYAWLLMLGAFIGVSFVADRWARSDTSPATQYAGLLLYVLFESIIFLPLLWIAQNQEMATGANIIGTAGVITLVMFGGLTAAVFLTGADFSFLRTGLMIAGFAAMGLIFCSILFGFHLGVLFTVAMIVFASAYILYDTSQVLHHYRTDQHVAASLSLFASVALLFWYVLRLVMSFAGDD